jgi:hypothetical protein
MYYDNARYYIPSLNRFNEADVQRFASSEEPVSLNTYLYCGANPIMRVDPSGHVWISPSIVRMIRGLGVDLAIRALVGIRATYVLGEAYREEVYPFAQVNMQIGRMNDGDLPPNAIDPGTGELRSEFLLRPDILDTKNHTVYEIKSEVLAWSGEAQVDTYLAALALRYPGQPYTPGNWDPGEPLYTIYGLPGITGLAAINIHAWNYGHGVIAYTISPNPEIIAMMVSLPYRAMFTAVADTFQVDLDLGEATLLDMVGRLV